MMVPSHQTEKNDTLEDLDKLAFKEYLIRAKICEQLARIDQLTPAANLPTTSSSTGSYWDRAKSMAELVVAHVKRYRLHTTHVDSSKLQDEGGKVYSNIKIVKALCIQGKLLKWCLVSKLRWAYSRLSEICVQPMWE